jgi:hypothetical protein
MTSLLSRPVSRVQGDGAGVVAAPQCERPESEHDRLASDPDPCAEDVEEEKHPVKG